MPADLSETGALSLCAAAMLMLLARLMSSWDWSLAPDLRWWNVVVAHCARC
uniref:Uncharacterized protein n=1 Tax=Arundo donax TaxID=35708 RepID=A0A0A9FX34_ARUDO